MVYCQKEAGASEFVELVFKYWFIHAETLVVILKLRIFFNHTSTGQHMRLSFSITKDPVKKNEGLMILPLILKAGCPEVDGGRGGAGIPRIFVHGYQIKGSGPMKARSLLAQKNAFLRHCAKSAFGVRPQYIGNWQKV
jgi:hypothetical protein